MIKSKLKEKRGSVIPLAMSSILIFFIIFSGVSEYLRLKMIVSGVRKAIQSSVISLSIENYSSIYPSSREGYSGSYKYEEDKGWEETLDIEDIYENISEILDLEIEGDIAIKRLDGKDEYKLSDLKVDILNTPFAPGSNEEDFEADTYASLEVPLSFGWEHLPP